MSIPYSICMSTETAVVSIPIAQHIVGMPKHVQLMVHLLYERVSLRRNKPVTRVWKWWALTAAAFAAACFAASTSPQLVVGQTSDYWPYIATLPDTFHTTNYLVTEELHLLQGTSAEKDAESIAVGLTQGFIKYMSPLTKDPTVWCSRGVSSPWRRGPGHTRC